MRASRLPERRGRPRRGSIERPLNGRLVRTSSLVLLLPLAVVAFTVSRPGPLPAPPLPPSFDGPAAADLARQLTEQAPNRVPGSAGDARAAAWFRDTASQYGLETTSDSWTEDVAGLGPVELENVAVVVPGTSKGRIAFLAHRDTSGVGVGANDDASGTAALIQLARSYAPLGTTVSRPKPLHTLVFVSTDAGAFGGLGAARFARGRGAGGALLAAVVLEGIGGGTPRLDIAGDRARSPAPSLVRTTVARVSEQTGHAPRLPGVLRQLVDLGIPFAYGDQAPLLGARVPALRLTSADDSGRSAVNDTSRRLDTRQIGRLGAAAESLLGSLDAAGELAQGTAPVLDVHGRFVRGWAVELLLATTLVPFWIGTVDLLARCRRLGVRLAPAFRALRRRVGFWAVVGALLWLASMSGVLPDGAARPLPPNGDVARDWPVAGVLLLGAGALVAWFLARRRIVPSADTARADEVAGFAAAFAGLAVVATLTAALRPFALVFVVPSLAAWLWLPQVRRAPARGILVGAGLVGVTAAVLSLGLRFGLGPRTPLYLAQLAGTGYLDGTAVALLLAWAAVASQVAVLAAGRYAPYAGGALRPPRGAIRGLVRHAAVRAQSRRT